MRSTILRAAYLILIATLSSCSTTYQKLDSDMFYKRDIPIEVNGRDYEGVSVVPQAGEYNITVEPSGELDLVLIRSCHREVSWEKQGSKKFLGIIPMGKNRFKYTYRPTALESSKYTCPLRIETYSSSSGRHSWAMIDIEDTENYKLGGAITCMGETQRFSGVGMCQAKKGLIQRLEFDEVVQLASPKPANCNRPEYKNGAFELDVSSGECHYLARTSEGKLARLTIVGFEGLLIREGQ